MPRAMLSSPRSSVSEESDSDEHDASCSELEAGSGSPRFRPLVFLPDALFFPEEVAGHARSGGGAVRDTRDCFMASVGECSTVMGEFERALSEEDAGCAESAFQESRGMGGPSSAVKSESGRSCNAGGGY